MAHVAGTLGRRRYDDTDSVIATKMCRFIVLFLHSLPFLILAWPNSYPSVTCLRLVSNNLVSIEFCSIRVMILEILEVLEVLEENYAKSLIVAAPQVRITWIGGLSAAFTRKLKHFGLVNIYKNKIEILWSQLLV